MPTKLKPNINNGVCKLCNLVKPLCNSHAIPDAVFKNILRIDSGKAVVLDSYINTNNRYSSDSWGALMLCKSCESHLNTEYDSYGINLLKDVKATHKSAGGLTFKNLNRKKLRLFFLSVLWRSAISPHKNYKQVTLDYLQIEKLRVAFLTQDGIPHSDFTVTIRKLENFTKIPSLSSENLATFIMAPFTRYDSTLKQNSVCYIFLGFFIEIFIGKLPKLNLSKPGTLIGNNSIFMVPFHEILHVHEFMDTSKVAIEKSDAGRSKVKKNPIIT